MAARTLTERVEILEQNVGNPPELQVRMTAVESQILQLRGDMHDGFSAIHQRFEGVDQRLADLKRQMTEGHEEAKRHMQVLCENLITRISLIQEGRGRKKR